MRVRQATRRVLVAAVAVLVGLTAAVTVAASTSAREEGEVMNNARQGDPALPGASEAPGKRQPLRPRDAAGTCRESRHRPSVHLD